MIDTIIRKTLPQLQQQQNITFFDVMQFLRNFSYYEDSYAITITGDFLKMDFANSNLVFINKNANPRWDFTKLYLQEQNNLVHDFLKNVYLNFKP